MSTLAQHDAVREEESIPLPSAGGGLKPVNPPAAGDQEDSLREFAPGIGLPPREKPPVAFLSSATPRHALPVNRPHDGSQAVGFIDNATGAGIIPGVEAVELLRTRIVYSAAAFAELVLWRLPSPLSGSNHYFKYRLAYEVRGHCVLRYDNEAGKGDHRHYGDTESRYAFTDPENLIQAFQADMARWNRENSDS